MKKSLLGIFIVLGIVVIFTAWYLLFPLFVDKEVNEEFPLELNQEQILDENQDSEESSTQAAMSVLEADFSGADSFHRVSGDALVLESGDQKFLRFENFESTNGPDLKVYLSDDLRASDFISLGELKGNIGNQNYELPSDVDLEQYPYVLIWCERFSVLFGSAKF